MAEEKMKVVMVEPNKPAYITEIGSDYESLRDTVGGLIELIYYLNNPNVVMVGNEEAKLIGMEGNRRFGDSIVAGPFFICGEKMAEDGADFCSLSDELCERYVKQFAVPEEISQHEVEQDMKMNIMFFGG